MAYVKFDPKSNMYNRNYNPIFHGDDTITYWRDSYGWFHRVHPVNVPRTVRNTWSEKNKARWLGVMKKLGYTDISGSWIKVTK